MNDKILSLLGMARRAGKLEIGFACAKESFASGKSYLVVCADDISPKTFKEIEFFAAKSKNKELKVVKLSFARETLSNAIGTSAACVAVCDIGFANRIFTLYNSGGTL